ncbi:hypothetical protein [Shewanella sp. 8A]|nr:hypothetical protein [Shewanella sp. 8A]
MTKSPAKKTCKGFEDTPRDTTNQLRDSICTMQLLHPRHLIVKLLHG